MNDIIDLTLDSDVDMDVIMDPKTDQGQQFLNGIRLLKSGHADPHLLHLIRQFYNPIPDDDEGVLFASIYKLSLHDRRNLDLIHRRDTPFLYVLSELDANHVDATSHLFAPKTGRMQVNTRFYFPEDLLDEVLQEKATFLLSQMSPGEYRTLPLHNCPLLLPAHDAAVWALINHQVFHNMDELTNELQWGMEYWIANDGGFVPHWESFWDSHLDYNARMQPSTPMPSLRNLLEFNE